MENLLDLIIKIIATDKIVESSISAFRKMIAMKDMILGKYYSKLF